ncbi:transposase [Hahella sp. NBU794]|uniref:transposase n=1 Tax=Hahella sp. NBU794 TaxID=3422590 RepID=UPI003D6E99F3
MITYRLNDALPREVITSLREIPEKKQRLEFENALDAGYGRCWLERPEIARLIVDNFRHFDSQRYELIAYVVMPNHTHVLIRIFDGMTLSSIVHGWKSYTAKKIASVLRASRPRSRFGNPNTGTDIFVMSPSPHPPNIAR